MAEGVETVGAAEVKPESPPAAPQPPKADQGDEARVKLHQLAAHLARSPGRGALVEYLRLRRALM
jgi:hypothetical protein